MLFKKTDVCVMKYYIVINCHNFMLKKKQDNLNITARLGQSKDYTISIIVASPLIKHADKSRRKNKHWLARNLDNTPTDCCLSELAQYKSN